MLAGLVYGRINASETHNGTAAGKTAHIPNFSHKLSGCGFTNAIHGAHSIVFRKLHGKVRHLGTQCGQRHLACKQLLRSCGNEQLRVVVLRQCSEMATAFCVDVQCFLCAEMVALALAPFLVTLCECLLADAADAVAVPEGHDKIHPFLVAVSTLRAGEQFIHAGKCLVGKRNEIVLQRHHRFHVEVVLATAQFQLLPYSIHGSIFPQIHICRERTDKPFGVNIMLMHPQAPEMARIVAEENIPVVTTGAGNPSEYVAMWKAAGCKVFPVIPAVALAKRLADRGVDGVIAEGTESGGHVGEMTTMALVPQVIDAVDGVPVVAAGGIADGRQAAAAFALGACGIQVGTCLLASVECPIHENYKQAILKAKDSDTVVTGRSVGGPVRCLKNKMTREYLALEKQGASLDELEKVTLGGLRRAVLEGDMEHGSVMSGQVAGMLHEIKPVRQIFEELYNGSKAVLEATSKEWL